MIEINRCSFCKNYIGLSNGDFGIPMCKAFPNGMPTGYNEFKNPGQKCSDDYKFELRKDKTEQYNRIIGRIEKNIKGEEKRR